MWQKARRSEDGLGLEKLQLSTRQIVPGVFRVA